MQSVNTAMFKLRLVSCSIDPQLLAWKGIQASKRIPVVFRRMLAQSRSHHVGLNASHDAFWILLSPECAKPWRSHQDMTVGANNRSPVSGKQCASENMTVRCTMVVIASTSPPPKACSLKVTPCRLPVLLPYTQDNRPPDLHLSPNSCLMALAAFLARSAIYRRPLSAICMNIWCSIAATADRKSGYVMCMTS